MSDLGAQDSETEFLPSSTASTPFPSSSRPSTAASSIISSPAFHPTYISASDKLEKLLRTCEPTSEPVQAALRELILTVPFLPPPQIITGLWGYAALRVDSHLNSTLEDAVNNIGTPISDTEKTFLQYIIQHEWGWSATPKQHLTASGFRYLQKLYPQIHGLRPILDNCTWPEEAKYMPAGLEPGPAFHILLASDSGYYFHRMDEAMLYEAGKTLEEVFEGLKYRKYMGPGGPMNDRWEGVDTCTDFFEPSQYFPNYEFDREEGIWKLGWEIPEPPESMQQWHEQPGIPISRYYQFTSLLPKYMELAGECPCLDSQFWKDLK